MTESEARAKDEPYRIARMPMAMVLRTHTLSQTRGFMKALISPDDRILGFTAFGAEASELMAVAQTSTQGGIPYTILRETIWSHRLRPKDCLACSPIRRLPRSGIAGFPTQVFRGRPQGAVSHRNRS